MPLSFVGTLQHVDGDHLVLLMTDSGNMECCLWNQCSEFEKTAIKKLITPWQLKALEGTLEAHLVNSKTCARQILSFAQKMNQVGKELAGNEKFGQTIQNLAAANNELGESIMASTLELTVSVEDTDD